MPSFFFERLWWEKSLWTPDETRPAQPTLGVDDRPPVTYLGSFRDERYSKAASGDGCQKEKLTAVLKYLGLVVALQDEGDFWRKSALVVGR